MIFSFVWDKMCVIFFFCGVIWFYMIIEDYLIGNDFSELG